MGEGRSGVRLSGSPGSDSQTAVALSSTCRVRPMYRKGKKGGKDPTRVGKVKDRLKGVMSQKKDPGQIQTIGSN